MIPDLKHIYARLPPNFHARLDPRPVADPRLVVANESLAETLGIDAQWLNSEDGLKVLAGNAVLPGTEPVAQAYAGHQFGQWVPQLGDGRALLLGEARSPNGLFYEIQLKGSGPTPFSRAGDGRASIGPVVREYLATEAMAALGVPTTRALAVVTTGEPVYREQAEPGGIVCRVASSHLRIGTFEYFARQGLNDEVARLVDFAIERHDPAAAEAACPALALLEGVSQRTAELVAAWMAVGFVHGVMNTDNLAISGETLDYGPFGFLDTFHPDTVFSYIDRRGRYAWGNQPAIAQWNLARLAECLLPLIDQDPNRAIDRANAEIHAFKDRFQQAWTTRLIAKIGLQAPTPEHHALADDLLDRMAAERVDMTLCFRALSELAQSANGRDEAVRALFDTPDSFDQWAMAWRAALRAEGRDEEIRNRAMRAVNPAFILRNHLAQRVADAAVEDLDFAPLHEMLNVFARPFDDQPEYAAYQRPPQPDQVVANTFCGT